MSSFEETLAAIKADKRYAKVTFNYKGELLWLPTGSRALDAAIGNGYPLGRIIEIIGPEASGKTTASYHALSEAQKKGKKAVFIDAEGTFDPNYFSAIGDLSKLEIIQNDTAEEALNIVGDLIGYPDVVIAVDSVAALVPQAEDEKDIGENSVGLQARLMSQACRKINKDIHESSLLIFTNQIREKIGVMYGSPETTPGGRALKFYASVRLDIRRIGSVEGGNRVKITVKKNKVAPPFREAELDLVYGKGFDKGSDLLDYLVLTGEVVRKGAWFEWNGQKTQGREGAIKMILGETT
jgi:recombination protein RecA